MRDGLVELTACDPGHAARAGPGSLEHALTVADQQDSNVIGALTQGTTPVVADCVGRLATGDQPLLAAEQRENAAYGPAAPALSARVQRLTTRLVRACRSAGHGTAVLTGTGAHNAGSDRLTPLGTNGRRRRGRVRY